MSIEQLQVDLKELNDKLTAAVPETVPQVVAFLQNELFPWLATFTEEAEEIDEAVEDVVHGSAEILHGESGAVFMGIITSGLAIANELAQRAGTDQRILKIVREFKQLCGQGKEILEEIVIPDPEEDEETDDDDTADDAPAEPSSTTQEGA